MIDALLFRQGAVTSRQTACGGPFLFIDRVLWETLTILRIFPVFPADIHKKKVPAKKGLMENSELPMQ